jgi:protein TonB
MASWGGQIRAQIERGRPRISDRGTVRVSLTVARDGRLLRAGVVTSSGNAALDRAALAMVQGAGRFRPAPEGLDAADHAFRLPIRFD